MMAAPHRQPKGKKAKMVFQVKQNCLKCSTESQVDEIKLLLEQHILKTGKLINKNFSIDIHNIFSLKT